MKKYLVNLYYKTRVEFAVEAENEQEALQQAREMDDECQLLGELQEISHNVEDITGD